jgi:hypothetical protein
MANFLTTEQLADLMQINAICQTMDADLVVIGATAILIQLGTSDGCSGLVAGSLSRGSSMDTIPRLSPQTADRAEIGGIDRHNGEGESRLGLRPLWARYPMSVIP